MAIEKQEFYEGAALHILVRVGHLTSISYQPPLFVLEGRVAIHLKHSTRGRSPWGFTFTPGERSILRGRSSGQRLVVGLICGADGIAALPYEDLATIAGDAEAAIHIACYRRHGEHYEIVGPAGQLPRKVAPSLWGRILTDRGTHETQGSSSRSPE